MTETWALPVWKRIPMVLGQLTPLKKFECLEPIVGAPHFLSPRFEDFAWWLLCCEGRERSVNFIVELRKDLGQRRKSKNLQTRKHSRQSIIYFIFHDFLPQKCRTWFLRQFLHAGSMQKIKNELFFMKEKIVNSPRKWVVLLK